MKLTRFIIIISIAITLIGCTPRHGKDTTPTHVLTFQATATDSSDVTVKVPIDVIIQIDDPTGQGGVHGVYSKFFNMPAQNPAILRGLRTPYTHRLSYAEGIRAVVTFTANYSGQISGVTISCTLSEDGTVVDGPNRIRIPKVGVTSAYTRCSFQIQP
jgi:hypothetical protein